MFWAPRNMPTHCSETNGLFTHLCCHLVSSHLTRQSLPSQLPSRSEATVLHVGSGQRFRWWSIGLHLHPDCHHQLLWRKIISMPGQSNYLSLNAGFCTCSKFFKVSLDHFQNIETLPQSTSGLQGLSRPKVAHFVGLGCRFAAGADKYLRTEKQSTPCIWDAGSPHWFRALTWQGVVLMQFWLASTVLPCSISPILGSQLDQSGVIFLSIFFTQAVNPRPNQAWWSLLFDTNSCQITL